MNDVDPRVLALAQALKNIEAQHIQAAIDKAISEHAILHEPSNRLHFDWDLDELTNVNMTGKADGDVPVWDDAAGEWHPGAGGTGSSKHSVAVGLSGTITISTVLPPGPVNPFGAALTIKKIYMYANDAVEMTIAGQAMALVGAGTDSEEALSITWADEALLTWSITSAGAALTSLGWTIEAE